MNKKILIGILMIGLISSFAGAGVYAYFTDTETLPGNVFQAGTVDITISAGETQTIPFSILDMKPCEVGYGTLRIDNVGTNPVNVYKTIENVVCDGGIKAYWSGAYVASSEPEYEAGFNGTHYNEYCRIDKWITYDLSVEVYDVDDNLIWWQVVFPETSNITIHEISLAWAPLGMIPFEGYMIVTQSYHMKAETGNWAQGDKMTFDIVINAEQLNGPVLSQLFMVPKTQGADEWIVEWNKMIGTGDDFDPMSYTGPHAWLDYTTTGPTFDYTLTAIGLTPNTDYSLIYYADPWKGDNPGALIGSITTNGTGFDYSSASVELNMDLPSSPDTNYPDGAKIWLVLSADYDGTKMIDWNPDNYLFEFSLIKYDDTDA